MGYFSFSPVASPHSSPSSIYSLTSTTSRSPSEYSSTASCAFPSWPRRQSLNDPSSTSSASSSASSSCSSSPLTCPQGFGTFGHSFEAEVTNYVSDDDLFPEDIIIETREIVDCLSVGSVSRSSSPLEQMDGMMTMEGCTVTASETIRDFCRKEREKETARREGRTPSIKRRKSSKKSRVSFSKVSMTPIAECGE